MDDRIVSLSIVLGIAIVFLILSILNNISKTSINTKRIADELEKRDKK